MVGGVFLLLFMFAGWFLRSSANDTPAKPYVTFVFTTTKFVLFPMTLILACWGLPADIKDRSIHTVVTKPVKRSEIVLGRMLGYSFLVTILVAARRGIGYVRLVRQVPDPSKEQLIARVPVFGTVRATSTARGNPGNLVNVGDTWDYRSFMEGRPTPADLDVLRTLRSGPPRRRDASGSEQEVRSVPDLQGVIDEQIRFSVEFVNEAKNLVVPWDVFPVYEFPASPTLPLMKVPRELRSSPAR